MAWLSGWDYRKQVNITGQSGAGTNYQVLLNVGESSGASGYDFHVEGHSANFPSDKNDGGDLRFTSSDGTTTLDFWVENVSGTSPNRTAKIWVEVADDLSSNQSIYCYYGNSGASNASNGDNTFLFFDDFDGSDYDSSKWSKLQQDTHVSYAVSSSVLRTSWGSGGSGWESIDFVSLNTLTTPFKVVSRQKGEYTGSSSSWVNLFYLGADAANNVTSNGQHEQANHQYYDSGNVYGLRDNGTWYQPSTTDKDTNWHTIEWKKKSGESKLLVDETQKASTTNTYTEGAKYLYWVDVQAANQSTVTNIHSDIDWIAVGKYISTEPAYSSAGSEENSPVTSNSIMFGMNF